MAKDGTNRGGRRVRAGDKPDALADKIANGREASAVSAKGLATLRNPRSTISSSNPSNM